MSWFKRAKKGISTKTSDKKDVPDGLWYQCPSCKEPSATKDIEESLWVCGHCGYHGRIGSTEYFNIFFDAAKYTLLFDTIKSIDPLGFEDTKKYTDRVTAAQKKTGLSDAIQVATGKMNGIKVVIAAMDFSFIGGSMGSVVGEKLARGIDYAREHKLSLVCVSKSGGARMMEAAFSLMQMAKTSAKLALMNREGLAFISYLTDPTTGGVTASFAMLGDFNIAEPKALIGFAGPRIVKETIGKDLPEGFQRSEFLQEKGFVDLIVERKDAKETISNILAMVCHKRAKGAQAVTANS
jgi:acetyl-CoA carboxylase carboxyl transferase subunit beta